MGLGSGLRDIRPPLDFDHRKGKGQRNIIACWKNNYVILKLLFLPQIPPPGKPHSRL